MNAYVQHDALKTSETRAKQISCPVCHHKGPSVHLSCETAHAACDVVAQCDNCGNRFMIEAR
ncbi:MAG: hypothetical protein AAFX94_06585 [Myxococcota bacterium]